MTTSGEELPRRGDVWWVRLDKLRPAVVVQTDRVRDPRMGSFLVVPLTSRLQWEGLPGNVRLERRVTGLSRPSVANVYDIQRVLRPDFIEHVSRLSGESLRVLDDGLRVALEL